MIGLKEFEADMGRLSARARSDLVYEALKAGAMIIWIHASENVRNKLNKHPTGFMVNNMGVRKEGKFIQAGVFGVVYAKIHEFGGVITPRTKKYLSWIGEDGKRVFTKKSVIPARPYLRPAVDTHMGEIRQSIISALVGLLKAALSHAREG